MARYILRRLGLAAFTLVLLSIIVFLIAAVLPGNVGRAILGPFADQAAIEQLNEELGLNGPIYERYWNWASGAAHLDFGQSYQYRAPVMDFIPTALGNSLKLAILTLIIVAPLGIALGAYAALHQGRFADRLTTIAGLSLAVTPEMVTGVFLIVLFAVQLGWFPASGSPEGSPIDQLRVMILPALTLTAVLFGYIARMTRAGTIEALGADYTRTAILKGLPQKLVLRRHVLRNSLLPTIAVVATQTGYLLGGLVVTEKLFNYQGIGLLLVTAADARDIPMMMAGVLVVGAIFMLMSLVADVLTAALNPRVRLGAAE